MRRVLVGGALAVLSAVMLTISFAPYDQWWLVFVALVPMTVAQHRVLPARWSAIAPAIGVGGFLIATFGGAFPERAAWYMKAMPALFAVGIFVLSRGERTRQEQRGYALWPLGAAMTWVAVEFARMPALATWAFFGHALYRQSWLIQPVRIAGIFGLDFLIVLVNYGIALLVMALIDRRTVPLRLAMRWAGGAALALAAWCALSLAMHHPGAPTVRIAVAQPGVRRSDVSDRAMLDRLSAQTREAAARGARIVVWPETALHSDPQEAYAVELGKLARELGVRVVVGYGLFTPAGARNEVITVEPNGQLVGRYGKNHPVGFLGGTSIWRGVYPTIATEVGTMASMICYDMDFTDTTRELARRGARIIAVPSADWPAIAPSHYTMAVFRALESGAAIAKSEFNRDSAIVDGWGRILASVVTPSGSAAVLVADVPLRDDGTPLAARLGDWFAWLCLAGLLLRILWRLRSRFSSSITPRP